MELSEALSFLSFVQEKQIDEIIWQRWLYHQQISYAEFKEQIMPRKVKSEEVILKEVKEILESFRKGGKNFGDTGTTG